MEGWDGRGSQELSGMCLREAAFSGVSYLPSQTTGLFLVSTDVFPWLLSVGDKVALKDRT